MWRPLKRVSRPGAGQDIPAPAGDVPEWVSQFRRWGVPLAAILVLVLCAPGEQHLADISGFSYRLSWGMAGLFTLYAGLASVISTQLPKGARGKTSSVWGAVLSLALAMGAQPVSHLFVTGYLTVEPKPPMWLVITVSSVPPLILGHLLHFAAMPSRPRQDVPVAVSRPRKDKGGTDATVTVLRPRTGRPAVSPAVSPGTSATVSLSKPQPRPALSPSPGTSKPSMGTRALSLLQDGLDEDTVADKLRSEYAAPDGTPPKANTVRKSITRAQDKLSSRP